MLIEQERLELPVTMLKLLVEPTRGEVIRNGSGPKLESTSPRIPDQPYAPKLARVGEEQDEAIGKMDAQAVMLSRGRAAGADLQVTAHAQVDEQVVIRQVQEEEFSPAGDIRDLLPRKLPLEFPWCWRGKGPPPAQLGRLDRPSEQERTKGGDQGLDFG